MKCLVCESYIRDGLARCPVCGFYVILNLEPDETACAYLSTKFIPAANQEADRQGGRIKDTTAKAPVFNQAKTVIDHLQLFYNAYGNPKMIPACDNCGDQAGAKYGEIGALRMFDTLKAFNRCCVENPGDFNSLCRRLSTVYKDGYDSCRQWLLGLMYMKKSWQSQAYLKKASQKFEQALASGFELAGTGLMMTRLFDRSQKLPVCEARLKMDIKLRAESGNAFAALFMGIGCYKQKNMSEAVRWLSAAWCGGAADAGWLLGKLENKRAGSKNNMNKVWMFYRMAWRRGCKMAASDMLDIFGMGYGSEKDIQSVAAWYEHQAHLGNVKAMRRLADLYSNPKSRMYYPQKGTYWLRMASGKGGHEEQT